VGAIRAGVARTKSRRPWSTGPRQPAHGHGSAEVGTGSWPRRPIHKRATHAPLTLPGMLSTAGHRDQSRVAAFLLPSFITCSRPAPSANPSRMLAGTTGLEPATSCVTGEHRMANSLTVRHGWQPKSTQKHSWNAQVVPILYSFRWSAVDAFLEARTDKLAAHFVVCDLGDVNNRTFP